MTISNNLGTALKLCVFLSFIYGHIYLFVVKHIDECINIKIKNKKN